MELNARFTLTLLLFSVLIAAAVLIQQTAYSEQRKEQSLTKDYAYMNRYVEKVLEDMPEMDELLENIRAGSYDENLLSSFSEMKTAFRFRVEQNITKQQHSPSYLKEIAEKEMTRDIAALAAAQNEYGLTVTNEEVDAYIEKEAARWNKDKRQFAKKLGITMNQLDYQFDRDLYINAALWEKIEPIIMFEHPRKKGERKEAYLKRIREEFYHK